MSYEFRPAKRENVPLLLGVAGGTGSGKTMSALRLSRGIANGAIFAGIDTENGRMNHYADLFPELRVTDITAPFRPDKYAQAIADAVSFLEAESIPAYQRVVLVDSASHEWAGEGGCLDWHDDLMGGDQKKSVQAWIEPKKSHKAMVTRLLQIDAHVILCFRAEPKVDVVYENGQMKIVPKAAVTGLDGWLPISEKMLPYELTGSFLLMADKPGVPKPIKLQEQHRPLVPLDQPLSEDVGTALAEWARGGKSTPATPRAAKASDGPASDDEVDAVLELAGRIDDETRDTTQKAITAHREKLGGQVSQAWLGKLRVALEKKLPAGESKFKAPAGAVSS